MQHAHRCLHIQILHTNIIAYMLYRAGTPTHEAEPNQALQKVRRAPEAQSESAAMLVVLPDKVCSVLPTTRSVAKSTCEHAPGGTPTKASCLSANQGGIAVAA